MCVLEPIYHNLKLSEKTDTQIPIKSPKKSENQKLAVRGWRRLSVDRTGRPAVRLATSRWTQSTGRSTGRQRGNFVLNCRSTDRSTDKKQRAKWFQSVDRSVDRQTCTNRACPGLKARSTGRSTGLAWKGSGRPARSTARPETELVMGFFLNFGNFSN